ncbi:N-acetylmuramoyl-L-alanine amidase domain [Syntrophomonas zehnderi OL-4]|uniref:N-acetylmuramoyl-L-alanine amidase n=1 Tax=Syntrophomonas zehnderi OL-4 TaxID=690567 RepID=A0A0E3W3B8_9FIRM|nr:N-acetylmuramoyl-L-alanine amidase [Syntrophomonas zehnderi]CFX70436.1 N-acetylmuramoyl-L-alanine amidase domain [Syntrophomonas zehnderi OL-4]
MSKYVIKQAASPNHNQGRGGKKIIAIVLHITAGLFPGCLGWMRNPAAKASVHYLITKTGEIYQLVQDTDTAWHAGIVNKPTWILYDGSNPNRYTLGIEFECLAGGELTETQYQAGLWLISSLTEKYKIPVDQEHIIGHYRIDSVDRPNDPGPYFPWGRLFHDLIGEKDVLSEAKIKVDDQVFTGFILKDNLSYAPVRALAEALGCKVEWDDKTKTVLIERRG